jgi:PAS domain S-box-containing protein
VSALTWSNHTLLNGGILHIPSVKNLPPEAQSEKEEFLQQGIQSLLAVPMIYQGNIVGLLGFDAVNSEKSWASDSVGLLQVAGSIFTNALENKRAQAALKRAHDELEQRVIERTQELERTNEALQIEVEQRKRAEESLQISQALYSEVFDNSPLQIFVQEVLPNGVFRVLRTNPAHQRASGMPPEKIWGKTVEELVIPEVAQAINQHYRDCIQSGHAIEYEEQGPSPYWDLDRIRTFRTTVAPVYDDSGNMVRLVGSSQDITDQKQAERIIMERTREEAVTAERSRLARELHDAVTQTLFSTTLTAEVLPQIWEKDPKEGQKKLTELRELTRGALAEMRTLLMELRPDALADAELKDLLRHLTNAFIARARIPIQVTVEGCVEPPLAVKLHSTGLHRKP